jgi:hypothetical protein
MTASRSCRIYPSRPYAVESTGLVWEWNTSDWSDAGHYEIPVGISAAALSPNSLVIALALQDGTIRFCATDTRQGKRVLAAATDAGSGLAITPDRNYDFGVPTRFAGLTMFRGIADALAGFVDPSSVPSSGRRTDIGRQLRSS